MNECKQTAAESQRQRMIVWEASPMAGFPRPLDEFRRFAARAASLGATHVPLNEIPRSTWQSGDPRDPHPEWEYWTVWSRGAIGLFKLISVPELAPWIPPDEVARSLTLLKKQCAVLRELGLRAILEGHEPMWWPEGVYEAHPHWRGPEVQHPSISRVSYHSPCLDHPEVLAMYRRAMAELCRQLPEVDYYTMLTNDSSAGICWAYTYPGKNGPRACRDVPLITRIGRFFDSLQEGARDAGHEITVNLFNAGFQIDGQSCYRAPLKPGQFIDGVDREERVRASGSGSNSWFGGYVYPVLGVPKVPAFIDEVEHALASDAECLVFSVGNSPDLLMDVYQAYRETPSQGLVSRLEILRRVAAARVGEDNAEALVELWSDIERATEVARYGVRGSPIMIIGPLMSRWTIMPLVPDVYGLTPEETAYFQRGRLAKTEIEALDYDYSLGRREPRGPSGVNHFALEMQLAVNRLEAAAAKADALVGRAARPEAAEELKALAWRLKALASLHLTCKNFVVYAFILQTRGADEGVQECRDIYNSTGTPSLNIGRWELCNVAREEMDNALTLADVLTEATEPVLAMAPTMAEEDGLVFAPNLVEQLHQKVSIMLKHWPEYNALYPYPHSPKTPTRPAGVEAPEAGI
ncbi:MAG: hypothetical protein AUJ92_08050 [Armatimonadetes bacterium CG2_30_59_28]|nr:hypothetical protein [Armatimonadota bacterium]OIO95371.1 MAG: hypothetical protein AUJ92_08050 [Armatimonadetes bacterium CG2_30_59_28]PIU65826.1 MAG: hypothetical protein COS85_07265 [Armatimonadetes bacterium CG07_land_8_20_14_0_80_59_28]